MTPRTQLRGTRRWAFHKRSSSAVIQSTEGVDSDTPQVSTIETTSCLLEDADEQAVRQSLPTSHQGTGDTTDQHQRWSRLFLKKVSLMSSPPSKEASPKLPDLANRNSKPSLVQSVFPTLQSYVPTSTTTVHPSESNDEDERGVQESQLSARPLDLGQEWSDHSSVVSCQRGEGSYSDGRSRTEPLLSFEHIHAATPSSCRSRHVQGGIPDSPTTPETDVLYYSCSGEEGDEGNDLEQEPWNRTAISPMPLRDAAAAVQRLISVTSGRSYRSLVAMQQSSLPMTPQSMSFFESDDEDADEDPDEDHNENLSLSGHSSRIESPSRLEEGEALSCGSLLDPFDEHRGSSDSTVSSVPSAQFYDATMINLSPRSDLKTHRTQQQPSTKEDILEDSWHESELIQRDGQPPSVNRSIPIQMGLPNDTLVTLHEAKEQASDAPPKAQTYGPPAKPPVPPPRKSSKRFREKQQLNYCNGRYTGQTAPTQPSRFVDATSSPFAQIQEIAAKYRHGS